MSSAATLYRAYKCYTFFNNWFYMVTDKGNLKDYGTGNYMMKGSVNLLLIFLGLRFVIKIPNFISGATR